MFPRPIHQSILAALALAAVAVGQNAPADGSFQVRYAANLGAQATSVIYSTGGVSPGFALSGFGSSTSPACASSFAGMQFTAVGNATLQQISVALSSNSTPVVTSATFQLRTDVGNASGLLLDTLTFTNVTATATLLTATSTSHPFLTAGTVYWLEMLAPACAATTQRLLWHYSLPAVAGNFAFNGGPGIPAIDGLAAMSLLGLAPVDPVINFTNTGANNAQDICVNTYTFAPDEQLISCCSCRVTRNALWSLRVNNDLTSNTLTPAVENSVVVKLLATAAPAAGNCNPALPGAPVPGLAAWGTSFHLQNGSSGTPSASETPFTNSTLSNSEQTVMTGLCGFIQGNGSGFGICRSCQGAGGGRIPIGGGSQNRGLSGDKQ